MKDNFERFISCKTTIDDVLATLRRGEGHPGGGATAAPPGVGVTRRAAAAAAPPQQDSAQTTVRRESARFAFCARSHLRAPRSA